jgi:hypothetical protein
MALLPLAKGNSTSPALRGANGAFALGKRGLHQPGPTGCKWRKGLNQPCLTKCNWHAYCWKQGLDQPVLLRSKWRKVFIWLDPLQLNGAGFNFSYLIGCSNPYTYWLQAKTLSRNGGIRNGSTTYFQKGLSYFQKSICRDKGLRAVCTSTFW